MAATNLTGARAKLCVTRATLNGRTVNGVFEWVGRSWITARLTKLVRELPASAPDAELRAAYRIAVKQRCAEGR
jgi:hypothetical protein